MLLLFLAWAGVLVNATSESVIHTSYGSLRGGPSEYRPGVTVYKGVPFASPPERWTNPTPPKAWDGTLDATEFAPGCPGPAGGASLFTSADSSISEDCLYLNIWTPENKTEERLPVYLWFYGGRFELGSGAVTSYDGSGLARKDVIVVTMNYRMGPFGFLAHPELSTESGHNSSGNYGLLDQQAALKWVHEEISNFGGDPDRITVGGQSAGSASALDIMYSSLTSGLGVAGVIAESGARDPRDPMTGTAATSHRSKEQAEAQGVSFLKEMNVTTISQLRNLSMSDLMTYQMSDDTIWDGTPYEALSSAFMEPPLWRPVIDGYVLPQTYGETLRSGKHLDVPILTGNNKDESGASPSPALNVTTYKSTFSAIFGHLSSEFLTLYPAANSTQADQSANAFYRDLSRVGTWNWARDWYNGGAKSDVYTYYWTHSPPNQTEGAFHGSELYYVFNNIPYGDVENATFTRSDYEIADQVSEYWANFIRSGDPNGRYLTPFPESRNKERTMWLGDSWGSGRLADSQDRFEFVQKYLAAQSVEW